MRAMPILKTALGFALAMVLGALPVRANLVADLSHHLVAITTAFAGSEVLLFGTVAEADRAVIVTAQGPPVATEVRRKTPVGPIWLNTQVVRFAAVPEFYAVAASAPLDEIADPAELARHQIGSRRIVLEPTAIEGVGDSRLPVFREALIRRKEAAGLYAPNVGRVTFIGDTLFRTTLRFPANTPPGNYRVQVFELERGIIVAAQTSTLVVSKVGLEAELFDVSRRNSILYGTGSILLAVVGGWTASVVFKKS
jgi:uncharacterized protein (TIGR02186 family)